MKTILTKPLEIIFNPKLNKKLGFNKLKNPPGTHLSEKLTNITIVGKIQLQCNCGGESNRKW